MDAGSLETLVRRAGPLPEGVVARIAADVLDGLAWLHRDRRMVHLDIKPGNILLNSAGEPKITDFGISAGTTSHQLAAPPAAAACALAALPPVACPLFPASSSPPFFRAPFSLPSVRP